MSLRNGIRRATLLSISILAGGAFNAMGQESGADAGAREVSRRAASQVRAALGGQRPELVLQTGHSATIRALAFSPDGKLLASGDNDHGEVRLWDVKTGLEVRTLRVQAGEIAGVSFTPDGRFVAGAIKVGSGEDEKNYVYYWEVHTGTLLRTFPELGSGQIGFTRGGAVLATASSAKRDYLMCFVDTASGSQRCSADDAFGYPPKLATTPSGWKVASIDWPSSRSSHVQLWDSRSAKVIRTLDFASGGCAVAFDPSGELLAGGTLDDEVRVWNAETGAVLRSLRAPGSVTSVAINSGGGILAAGVSCARDAAGRQVGNLVALWDLRTGMPLRSVPIGQGCQGYSPVVGFSPTGSSLAVANGKALMLLDPLNAVVTRTLAADPPAPIRDLAVSPDGRLLATGQISVWDLRQGTLASTIPLPKDALRAGGIALGPEGKHVAGLFEHEWGRKVDRYVRVWDLATGKLDYDLAFEPYGYRDDFRLVSVLFGSRRLLAAASQSWTIVWDTASGEAVFGGESAQVQPQGLEMNAWNGATGLALSPDEKTLVTAEEQIRVWDLATGARRFTVQDGVKPTSRLHPFGGGVEDLSAWDPATYLLEGAHSAVIRDIKFSPDGTLLATASRDRTIKLWHLGANGSLTLLRTLGGHKQWVGSVAFSPDGSSLASAGGSFYGRDSGEDFAVRLWSVKSGELLHSLQGHSAEVSRVAFSADGRIVISASLDGKAIFWDVGTGEMLATALSSGRSSDWAVVTPDGLVDGTVAGLQDLVGWRFADDRVAPLEAFFNEFYYPGLLAEIMAGNRPVAPRDLAAVDRRQPAVTLSLADPGSPASTPITARTVKVTLSVAEAPADSGHPNGSGALDARLFRNGSLVKVWRGDVLQGKGGKAVLNATVPIVAGENRLTAYAFNRDNVKSVDSTILVRGDASLKRQGTVWVLAIGINRYENADYDLSYAVADATVFADELRRQESRSGEPRVVEVVSLLDGNATKANILSALSILAGGQASEAPWAVADPLSGIRAAEPEDTILVYFAGHGTARGQRFYLIPHDLGYEGLREELDRPGLETMLAHSISDVELERAFEGVDAGRMVLVIDACNSGQALEAEEKRRGPMNSKGLAQLAYEKGMYILTAAQGYQAALEAVQLGHGLLTFALVEEGLRGLAGDNAPRDGRLVVREWLDYASLRVPQLQMEAMQVARAAGREMAIVTGERDIQDLKHRTLQRPRVFYRREPEVEPFVVTKSPAASPQPASAVKPQPE